MLPLIVMLLIIGCAVEAVFIVLEHNKKMTAALVVKSAASFLFVSAGVLATGIARDATFSRLILAGLILGLVGDVCLNLRFVLTKQARPIFLCGIAAFLFGHVAYLAALALLEPGILLYALPAGAILAFFVVRFVLSRVNASGVIRIFGIVYLSVVVLMATFAAALYLRAPLNGARALFAAGGILFAASDVLLVLNQFGKRPYPAFRALNLSLYYLGQACIALTIAHMN